MGSGNSHHQTAAHYLDPPMIHEPPPAPYPDMNMIFKSIPKMMQVADDMHRMSNYIMDLRNMMFACSVFSVFGIFMFLLMKYLHGRRKGTTRRRQRRNHNNHRSDDSEQSSLSIGRPMIVGTGAGGSSSGYRHYHAARPVDGWAAHAAALSGADVAASQPPPRVMVDSTSTRHTHIGTPLHGGGGGGMTSTTAPLLMNSTPPGRGTHAVPSPEHHQQAYQQQQNGNGSNNHYSTQQPQYAMVGTMCDSSPQHHHHNNNNNQTPTPISPATSSATGGGGATATTPNGQLKRLEPVKLVVEEMPYMEDNNNEQQQQE